ncbi:hypothetical protein C0Q70_19680 [Pomacea canaliculata]|uniref:Alanine--tRNA ligase n=1 Tax=Pomacea canaliculata TaxID=400727 RepID=A0A2T7NDH5_POMCA|nr:hypothetical protein C0Q70_19680 [Pomacea canaliculata]
MANYRRVVNSQKCIRVGGKHNDFDDVGKDLTHHTFFEMLGNWSFGDYFKEQACQMAFTLLTTVYQLPQDRLYFTYFGGNSELNLSPDTECRDIWRSLGIAEDRILPFGMKENFWDMGDTGPCGPCTEIHYDHNGSILRDKLVNTGSPDIVEIWNLASGVPAYLGRVGAEDTNGLDTAYRILADHARMFTVAISDGLVPSNSGLSHKLQQILYRCIRQCQTIFNTDPRLLCILVDHVAQSLGEAFPEICERKEMVKAVVAMAIENYLQLKQDSRKSFQKMLKQLNSKHVTGDMMWELYEGRYGCSVPHALLLELAEEFGVSMDLPGFEQRLQQEKDSKNNTPISAKKVFSHQCFEYLHQSGIALTDDSFKYTYSASETGYDFPAKGLSCKVVGMFHNDDIIPATQEGMEACIILDKTCFYAEAGGQAADTGILLTDSGEFEVKDVQEYHDYVLHFGKQQRGHFVVGDNVQPILSQADRLECMKKHTATHLLQSALRKHLGPLAVQKGSNIQPHRLTFDFLCLEDLASEKVMQIENSVVKEIRAGHPVSRTSMSLQEALSRGDIVTIPCEKYPSKVTLVQIGDCEMAVSRELCRGTHVLNTRDIEDFCITRVTKVSRGIKRIYAVTGMQASEAHHAGEQLMKLCAELEAAVKTRCQSVNKIQEFTARIHQAHLAGKPVTKLREELMAAIKTQSQGAARMQELSTCIHQMTQRELTPYVAREHVMFVVKPLDTYVTEAANFQKLIKLRTMVEDLLLTDRESNFVLQSMKFEGKQILKALSMLETDRPLVLISPDKTESAVTFVWPKV